MYHLSVLFIAMVFLLIPFSSVFADSIFIKSGDSVIKISDDDEDDEDFFGGDKFFKDDDEEDEEDDNDDKDKNYYIKEDVKIIEGESCGLNIKDKDIKNSVIENKVIINGKKVNKSCFKNGGSSVNLGISIEGKAKIKNSVIKNESVVKDSEIIINGKKVIK